MSKNSPRTICRPAIVSCLWLGAILLSRQTVLAATGSGLRDQPESSPPATREWTKRLEDFDARTVAVQDLTARFEERKHTALLKEPMVSRGRLWIKGSRARWETLEPHRTTLLLDETHVRIYLPDRRVVEVYPMRQHLRRIAISPQPRLGALRSHFEIEPAADTPGGLAPADRPILSVRLIPRNVELREYLDSVTIHLDESTAQVVQAVLIDPDGDRTILTFSEIRTNQGLTDGDVTPPLPADTQVIYPLGDAPSAAAPSGDAP